MRPTPAKAAWAVASFEWASQAAGRGARKPSTMLAAEPWGSPPHLSTLATRACQLVSTQPSSCTLSCVLFSRVKCGDLVGVIAFFLQDGGKAEARMVSVDCCFLPSLPSFLPCLLALAHAWLLLGLLFWKTTKKACPRGRVERAGYLQ